LKAVSASWSKKKVESQFLEGGKTVESRFTSFGALVESLALNWTEDTRLAVMSAAKKSTSQMWNWLDSRTVGRAGLERWLLLVSCGRLEPREAVVSRESSAFACRKEERNG
jgi:hypothetical protein